MHFACLKNMIAAAVILSSVSVALSQHRGDILNFQGIAFDNRSGVKSQAMGGAFTAVAGELDALFWNPAGLARISGLQFSANFTSANHLWRENQEYRPNRQLVTMSFILDGLYRPNPAFNGWLDNEAFFEDSTYVVNEPLLGKDSYSEEAADWQKELDDSGLNNLAAALLFSFASKRFVVSAGYTRRISVTNYDRNQTHLSPHIAFDGYGDLPGRVTGGSDSIRIVWSDYERQRSGPLRNLRAALAVELNKHLNLGIGINRLSGKTKDFQALKRVGNFDLVQGIQIFRFSYDTLDAVSKGSSDFSATSFNLGAILTIGRLSLGANLTPGYTITRKWRNTTTTSDEASSVAESFAGEDKLKIPLAYSLGVSVNPHDRFRIAFDLEHRPYSESNFELAQPDSTFRSWADQTSFRLGLEFKAFKDVALLAGYRHIPQVFVPDGAAISDRGPETESYTLGMSLHMRFIRFDVAYEIATLKYYDAYFSNTNYAYERATNLLFGATLTY